MVTQLQQECFLEYQRYADTTLIITLFSELLNKDEKLGKIRFIEKDLKVLDENLQEKMAKLSRGEILNTLKEDIKELKKVEVDLVIDSGNFEIVEFKTSVSSSGDETQNTVKQILARDSNFLNDLEILETKSILFVCHKDDSSRILKELSSKKELAKRSIIVFEWMQGDNKAHKPCLYVSFKDGICNDSPLAKKVKGETVCGLATDLYILRQRRGFLMTGKKPPKQYLLSMFKQFLIEDLHEVLNSPRPPAEYALPGSIEEIREHFINRFKSDFSKPKKSWFDECVKEFKELKLLKTVTGNKIIISIDELTRKRRIKDDDEYFSDICAKKIQKEVDRKKKTEEKLKKTEEREKKKLKKAKKEKEKFRSSIKTADLSNWMKPKENR